MGGFLILFKHHIMESVMKLDLMSINENEMQDAIYSHFEKSNSIKINVQCVVTGMSDTTTFNDKRKALSYATRNTRNNHNYNYVTMEY